MMTLLILWLARRKTEGMDRERVDFLRCLGARVPALAADGRGEHTAIRGWRLGPGRRPHVEVARVGHLFTRRLLVSLRFFL